MSKGARTRAAADPLLLGYTVTSAPDPIQVTFPGPGARRRRERPAQAVLKRVEPTA